MILGEDSFAWIRLLRIRARIAALPRAASSATLDQMSLSRAAIAFAVLVGVAGRVFARDPIKVSAKERTDGVTFEAENDGHCPAVVRITLPELVNATANHSLPCAFVLEPFARRDVLRIQSGDLQKRWSYRWEYSYRFGMPATHDDGVLYQFPFDPSTPRYLDQGNEGNFTHSGAERYAFDFVMPVGTKVLAARAGVVARIVDEYSRGGPDPRLAEMANEVLILHDDGTLGRYRHIAQGGAVVAVGQRVVAGQEIATSGNVGFSTQPHLHFDVRVALMSGTAATVPIRFTSSAGPLLPSSGSFWPRH